jgi:hypothetical protein
MFGATAAKVTAFGLKWRSSSIQNMEEIVVLFWEKGGE